MRNVRTLVGRGYTLTELVIVIAILGLVAVITAPATSTGSDKRLDLAANEFAAAISFARSESIRTGQPHGFRFLSSQYQIQVFSTDTSANPWAWVLDIYHPVEKQLYDYTFPAELTGATPPVTHAPIFRGTCNTTGVIYFNADGTPWCLQPETVLLDSYQLNMHFGSGQRSVRLDGITGRVTVQ